MTHIHLYYGAFTTSWERRAWWMSVHVGIRRLNYRSLLQKSPIKETIFWSHIKCGRPYGVATISRLLKIIGLFCRIPFFYRALLQKRPVILRNLLIVATPYEVWWLTKWPFTSTIDMGIRMCDMTHSYLPQEQVEIMFVRHDSCATWLIHMAIRIHDWYGHSKQCHVGIRIHSLCGYFEPFESPITVTHVWFLPSSARHNYSLTHYWVAKTHRMPYLFSSFPAKAPCK